MTMTGKESVPCVTAPLTLFEEGEAIPLFEEGGDKFVLHPKKAKSIEKK